MGSMSHHMEARSPLTSVGRPQARQQQNMQLMQQQQQQHQQRQDAPLASMRRGSAHDVSSVYSDLSSGRSQLLQQPQQQQQMGTSAAGFSGGVPDRFRCPLTGVRIPWFHSCCLHYRGQSMIWSALQRPAIFHDTRFSLDRASD